jgi:membrane-bound lytic murein transglycosylase B
VVPVEASASLTVLAAASPKALLGFYAEGERAWGTPWTVLAAVNFVESRFGRVVGPSPAGALGPMQFMPETWRRWGDGGDVMDPHDSILAAARYLQAHEVLRDPRGALFEYNRSDDYVEAILNYAGEMQRDRCSFFAYYLWQPFVQTVAGDRAQVES